MKYRNRTTGYIYNSLFELQQQFPNVSFPQNWDDTTFNFANVDPVIEVPEPAVTNIHNRIDFDGVKFIGGVWTETWIEVPKYNDPVLQTEWEAECLESQWKVVRGERDRLISMTDYTQLPDTPITPTSKANFITYRQTLRDITNQSDPYNITWPIVPIYEKQ